MIIFVGQSNLMTGTWYATWFNSPYYEVLYRERGMEEASRFLDRLLAYLKPPPDSRMLDLACGSGRHANELSQRGFDVVGMDLSDHHIIKAQKNTSGRLRFYRHDMRHAFHIRYFDYVFNFFTSFGYFERECEHVASLRNVTRSLRENGRFVLDYFNAIRLKQMEGQIEEKNIENVHFSIEKGIEGDRVVKRIRVRDGAEQRVFQERVALLERADFDRMFAQAGLQIVDVFGDYDLSPFQPERSDRFILIAERSP